MLRNWQHWNRKAKLWLWIITLLGVAAALPLGGLRMHMEKSSKQVEYVFDYRDLLEVADYQANPREFVSEQLDKLKQAGITTMSLYESSLKELSLAGRLTYYSSKDEASLRGQLPPQGQNYTYVLFKGAEEQAQIGPIVRDAFTRLDIPVRDYSFEGRSGFVIETPLNDAMLKPISFDPMTLAELKQAGFHILARFSDRAQPFDSQAVDKQLAQLQQYGVTRILFDGDKVKGFSDQAELHSLDSFGELLNKYGMGIVAIENLKKPQAGLNKLAYLTDYNVTRLYSLPDNDGMALSPEKIVDRFLLAAKDRNIRMFFINATAQSSQDKAGVVNSLANLYLSLKGPDGAVHRLEEAGFKPGEAQAFKVDHPSWAKPLRGVVALGAIAIITLLISAFIPGVAIPVFIIGLIGAAGLYVLNSSLDEQALALGAGISAPTLALIWATNRVYAHTEGKLRSISAGTWTMRSNGAEGSAAAGLKWLFEGMGTGRRFGMAVRLFIMTALISLLGIPLVFGLLNNITYSLVLEQFRGVSLLHLAPIALVALYVVLYTGDSPIRRLRGLLVLPIKVWWVVAAVIIAVAGLYYLSRTGNSGEASSLELVFRNWLENTFGVRPRTKEFLLAHPLLLLGLFLSLRYRAAWVLIIAGSIGQLSMVDTFAHIHTPLQISIIRVLLGLGLGFVIGCVLIAIWLVLEGVWRKWLKAGAKKLAES
ncbi:DUF5693 family protein [Paenibacillus protaetiae]|uniref:Uncharacterized protein n=1 Tax=Paenibacillus protaetiae TaxID=2509456 RepID=A0A4P6EXE2_9BACL|nr:DUF5693 family protein [Paenibacillus protaetiae]QAY67734.1 hypothetical protein ET464_16425 [Paenibacillus protaetiae]